MKNKFLKVLKYEFLNIARSRWVFIYTAFIFTLATALLFISGTPSKAIVSISEIITILVPLTCVLFSSFYWYSSERLTELLMTQPLGRTTILAARYFGMNATLGLGFCVGVLVPFLVRGHISAALLFLIATGFFLVLVFSALGLLIGILIPDRMHGVGIAFAGWFYFVLVHDALVLVLLSLSKDFSMDYFGTLLVSINPIGLTRVALLVNQDAAMLLGHSGAIARQLLIGTSGMIAALLIAALWLVVPSAFAFWGFRRKDL